MQRSSDAIAALAAALAKAQIELENPEKSLTASIPSTVPGGVAQSFRYASLASGLDLVRKSLGRQEIAVIQSTTIDQAAGIVRLVARVSLAHLRPKQARNGARISMVNQLRAVLRRHTRIFVLSGAAALLYVVYLSVLVANQGSFIYPGV